ncbi:MAG TPA: SCO family protein [Rhizomicrobium sp.]|nr:SCO family protein [Rhizomicrobium sp.]
MRILFLFAALFALAACAPPRGPVTDIAGAMPDLRFSMGRANDGKTIDAGDYRGDAVVLYFGYTNCPDACPTTLSDLATVLKRLGPEANDVRVLFVTVDPGRDTLSVLKTYVTAFAPQIDGLRGSANAVARLARRYRVTYRVDPGPPYQVMHSDSVFFFDRNGHARYVATSVADAGKITAILKRLLD